MNFPPSEGTTPKENGKRNLISKIGEGDPQFEVLGALVRLGVLVWSGAILTLTYVQIPGMPQQKIDPTFIASVFTGALATFGVQSQKRDDRKSPNEEKKKDAKAD